MTRSLFLALALLASPVSAAVVNGDFETGDLSGYTTDISGPSGVPFDTFASVQTSGGNSFFETTTGSVADGLSQTSIMQSTTVTSATSLLTFDTSLIEDSADQLIGAGSAFQDNITFFIFDSSFNYIPVFALLTGGGGVDPFGGNPVAAAIATTTSPSDTFFDTGVSVDLTRFIGQDILFGIATNAYNDGRILTGRYDNIAFSAPTPPQDPSAVPLPASLPLLAFAFGALTLLRRRPGG